MNDPKVVPSENSEENKTIERMIDVDTDFLEHGLHERPILTEGLGEDL